MTSSMLACSPRCLLASADGARSSIAQKHDTDRLASVAATESLAEPGRAAPSQTAGQRAQKPEIAPAV